MIVEAALWGLISTCPLLIGAWIAIRFRPSPKVVGIVMGFGAGALISAIAYELIPSESTGQWQLYFALGLGAATFYLATSILDRRSIKKGKGDADEKALAGKTIVLGALLDGIPESIVLGMSLVTGNAVSIAFLGAVFVSNLPESIGATAEMDAGKMAHRRIFSIWLVVMAVCIIFVIIGGTLVELIPGAEGSMVSAFAAGAVLVVLSDSMIPEGFSEGGRPTGLMVVLGFAFAAILAFVG